MDLRDFMRAVGATLEDVAAATGLDISTISRIRSGETQRPTFQTIRAIEEWATREARRKRVPAAERLDWDYLDRGPQEPSEAAG